MSLVEKELTQKNVERARNHPEFEQYNETEHKLTSTDPELLKELFMHDAYPIEQYYLSTPYDEFSLRVRCAYKSDGPEYTGTLKDRGSGETDSGLNRLEVSSPISPDAFNYYKRMNLPGVRKLRADIMKGVSIDFYDNPDVPVIVEVEDNDPEIRAYLLKVMQDMTGNTLVDRSNDPSLTNEALAYRGIDMESIKEPESLDDFTHRALSEAVAVHATGKDQVFLTIDGLPGSGKTTVIDALEEQLVELFGEEARPAKLSTDDFHFGKKKLEQDYGAPYVDWDAPRTYNTREMAAELERLARGELVRKRGFDFETEEPFFYPEFLPKAKFVIIEGIHASSRDLQPIRDLHFRTPTGPATSVGRDARRLVIDGRANRAFPNPPSRMRYQLEVAIPTCLEQEIPSRKAFSANVRPLAERAFMLEAVRELATRQ